MKKKLGNITKIIVLCLILFLVPVIVYFLTFQGFKTIEFKDKVEINYNEPFKFDSGNLCYNSFFKCHEVSVQTKGMVNTSEIGEYRIYYTYQYNGEILTKKQIVKVKENEAPVITVEDTDFNICPTQKDAHFKVSAYDNYDKDLTDKVKQYIKDDKVYFEVADSSGNKTVITKDLTYTNQKPVITLMGGNMSFVKLNGTFVDPGATAYDDCEGDISSKIQKSGNVDTTKVGGYQITYSVSDNAGNSQSVARTVYVYPESNYSTSTGKIIYLTFDDGPSAYTTKLLDILKKYNIKATFFLTNPKGYDSVILREYNEGHTIGLHSNTHDYSQIYQNTDAYFDDLYTIQNKVKEITGYTSTIIRFPGGSSNLVSRSYDGGIKIMSILSKEVEEKGFKYFDWNISSEDAGGTTSTSQVFANIVTYLNGSGPYVVLQHDTKNYSIDAVEDVIRYGLANGYTFMPLSMSSPTVHHHIAN